MKTNCFVLCLMFLAVLGISSVSAEQQPAETAAPAVVPLLTAPAPALCKAAPVSQNALQIPGLEAAGGEAGVQDSEYCYPIECGSGAAYQQCSSACCRYKCCIC